MVGLLSKIDPMIYEKYVIIERRHTVLYAALAHPLNGNLRYILLLWGNLEEDVQTNEIKFMKKSFGRKYATLTVRHGKMSDYLGMTIYYYLHEKVKVTMFDYIEGFISKIPYSLKGDSVTDATNNLFEVGDDTPMIHPTDEKIYCHHLIQILWLTKRSQPELLPPLPYLTTCVKSPNNHNWKKMTFTCKYLHITRHIPLILESGSIK